MSVICLFLLDLTSLCLVLVLKNGSPFVEDAIFFDWKDSRFQRRERLVTEVDTGLSVAEVVDLVVSTILFQLKIFWSLFLPSWHALDISNRA